MRTLDHPPLPDLDSVWSPVERGELKRLMEMPADAAFDDREIDTIHRTEQWCQAHVRPRQAQRQVLIHSQTGTALTLEAGPTLRTSSAFARKLEQTRAHAVVVFSFTLGEIVDRRKRDLWNEGRYDESYVLSAYGTALVEAARACFNSALCKWAESNGCSVIACDAPGYEDWPIEETHTLHRLLLESSGGSWSGQIRINESGMMQPLNSIIMVFALNRFNETGMILSDRIPCQRCGLPRCRFRRKPAAGLLEASTA